MKPLKILPANEIVLKRRFPDVLRKINESADRMPDTFYYEEDKKGFKLMVTHGDFTFCPYGDSNQQALVERWAQNLNLVPESLYASRVWVTVLISNIC